MTARHWTARPAKLVAPIRAGADFDQLRQLANEMAAWHADRHPDALTVEQRKNQRRATTPGRARDATASSCHQVRFNSARTK
jgi:DNA primase